MVMVIRTVSLANTTGAVVAAGGAGTTIGQDYAGIQVKRTMAAADLGTGAGAVRHAEGMIFAEVTGGYIKGAQIDIYRIAGGFTYKVVGAADGIIDVGAKVVNVAGVSTLRVRDNGAAAGCRLLAGDIVVVTIQVGNS
jgi:hypothetical protein